MEKYFEFRIAALLALGWISNRVSIGLIFGQFEFRTGKNAALWHLSLYRRNRWAKNGKARIKRVFIDDLLCELGLKQRVIQMHKRARVALRANIKRFKALLCQNFLSYVWNFS